MINGTTTTKLQPFTREDWWAFCGCDSENPLIAYEDDLNLVAILDGTDLVVHPDSGEGLFDHCYVRTGLTAESAEAVLRTLRLALRDGMVFETAMSAVGLKRC